jgi:hypothetical protein
MQTAQNQDQLQEHLKQIRIRLQESVFENAKFTKRLHQQMIKSIDVDNMQSKADKLNVIREVFSMHIVLCFFTQKDHFQIEGELN